MPESIFQGTILCKYHAKGKCQKGDSCKFAHGKTALKIKPDLSKTKMCTTYKATGHCKYGEDCNYAHDRNEIRRNILSKKQKRVEWDGLQLPIPARSVTDPAEALASALEVDLELPVPVRSQSSSDSEATTASPPMMIIDFMEEDEDLTLPTPVARSVTWASSSADAVSFEELDKDEELSCLGKLVGWSAAWTDTNVAGSHTVQPTPAPGATQDAMSPGDRQEENLLDVMVKNTFLHFQPAKTCPMAPLQRAKSCPLFHLEEAAEP